MPFAPSTARESSLSRSLHTSYLAAGTACIAIALSAAMLLSRRQPNPILLIAAMIVLGIFVFLHGRSLQRSRKEFLRTRLSLRDRDLDLCSLLDGSFDAVLILDDQLICRKANRAATQLLGVSGNQIVGKPLGQFACDGPGFAYMRKVLREQPRRGQLELMRADGVRILTDFSSAAGRFVGQHVLMLRDQTALVCAEEARDRNLTVVRSSLMEIRMLRRATLVLAQAPPLNTALDDLLEIAHSTVPCESAGILLFENPNRLLCVRRKTREGVQKALPTEMFDLDAFPALREALEKHGAILLDDSEVAPECCRPSWEVNEGALLCIPLFVAEERLGFLSLVGCSGRGFAPADLRLAVAIAVPIALAVYNARLTERADIFRSELAERLRDLRSE